jgi:hypothetical protein
MSGSERFTDWLSQFPELMALLVIIAGWVTAILVRRAVAVAVPRINRSTIRLGSRSGPVLSPQFAQLLQHFVFWGILLASVILGFSLLGDGEVSRWIDGLWVFVSHLLVALGILAVGHILGLLARSLVNGLARDGGAAALSRMAYAVIAGIAIVMAISHLGLDISFLTRLVLVILGVLFAGLALAFALGARALVANLTAQNDMQCYTAGDRIRLDDVEGTVLEIHRTGLVLSTAEGLARIPAAKFAEMTVIVLHKDAEDDG